MWSWKGVPKQECPDTDCVCSCLWWESCIDMDASHIFLQGILAGITLAGGRAGDGVARAEPGVRWGFPTTQWPSLPFRSGVWSQAAGEEALRVEPTHGGSVPSKYMPSPFLALGPAPDAGENQQGGPCRLSAHISHRQRPEHFLMQLPVWVPQLFLCLCSDRALGASSLCSLQPVFEPILYHPRPVVKPRSKAGGFPSTLGIHWGISCGRVLGCFRWFLWISTNNGHSYSTWAQPQRDQVASEKAYGLAFSPV